MKAIAKIQLYIILTLFFDCSTLSHLPNDNLRCGTYLILHFSRLRKISPNLYSSRRYMAVWHVFFVVRDHYCLGLFWIYLLILQAGDIEMNPGPTSSPVICPACNLQVTGHSTLECGVCKKIFHPACENFSEQDLQVLAKNNVTWLCTGCKPILDLGRSLNDIKNKIDSLSMNCDLRLNLLESTMETTNGKLADLEGELSAIKSAISQHGDSPSTREPRYIDRRRNIIIFNAPEPTDASSASESHRLDESLVDNLCNMILGHSVTLDFTKRLGRKQPNAPYARPLLIGTLSEIDKHKLLHASKQHSESINKTWPRLIVTVDRSMEERAKRRHQRNQDEHNRSPSYSHRDRLTGNPNITIRKPKNTDPSVQVNTSSTVAKN